MAVQAPDVLRVDDWRYEILAFTAGSLFQPSDLGLRPTRDRCPSCWPSFRIEQTELMLDTLAIDLDEHPPAVMGVLPQLWSDSPIRAFYEGIPHKIRFSGGLLGGEGRHTAPGHGDAWAAIGRHPAWRYYFLVEFAFEEGRLIRSDDRSSEIDRVRQCVLGGTPTEVQDLIAPHLEIDTWIQQRLRPDYSWIRKEYWEKEFTLF